MKKVLIMNNVLHGGGVEKVMFDIVNKLLSKNYNITIVTFYRDKKFNELYSDNISYYWLMKSSSRGNSKISRFFYEIQLKIKILVYTIKFIFSFFDIVIAMKEGPSMKFLSRIITCKNKVGWVHIDMESMHWTKWTYKNDSQEYQCMLKYRTIICVSNKVKDSVCQIVGDTGNLIVRYNPINKEKILNASKENVQDFTKNANKILFMSIGRLHYQKGYDMLIDAVEQLKDYEDQFEVVILGEGPCLESYKQALIEKSIRNIFFLGNKANPYKYLKQCDWFLSTSRVEGYSLVSQEAAVLDRPIIATNCSGIPELLGDNSEYGIMIECNTDAIYNAMLKVLKDSSLQHYYEEKISKRKESITYKERLEDIMEIIEK